MTEAARAVPGAVLLAAAGSPGATAGVEIIGFDHLAGWAEDDHSAALTVFRKTCDLLRDPDWRRLCRVANDPGKVRVFFETHFRPVVIGGAEPSLFTGYYEPEVDGALAPTDRFRCPLFACPPDLPEDRPWATRAEIEDGDLLAGRGLEIAWVEDAVERFFLQVQGSGRIRLPDGQVLRVGYGGRNGHEYRSIGKELIRRGVFTEEEISADAIKSWIRCNTDEGMALLRENPSYVFFREVEETDPQDGPLGAMDRPVTAGRSLAVDPVHVPLGAPVWIETSGAQPIRRLMVAQDIGSAIKGPQRGDIFFGTGDAAGSAAGRMHEPGRMAVLLPVAQALSFAGGSQTCDT